MRMFNQCFAIRPFWLCANFFICMSFGLLINIAAFARDAEDTNRDTNHAELLDSWRFSGFVDQSGQLITPARLVNKFVLVNFIFSACVATCPMQTAEMAAFQRQLPDDMKSLIHIVSVSVDPATETPESLNAFAEKFGADFNSWSFITASPEDFARVRDEFAAIYKDAKGSGDDFNLHTTDINLFLPTGDFVMRYSGKSINKQRLTNDIRNFSAQLGSP